jgi:hypothetical protein
LLNNLPIPFWIILILFVGHQLLQYVIGVPLPYVDSYFDPFACAVLGLSAILWERKYLWKANQHQLGAAETIVTTIVLAIISEQLFPFLSNRFYSDPFDYLSFVAGGIYFYFLINDRLIASSGR